MNPRSISIFLADDDDDDVFLFRDALDELPFEVTLTTFSNGAKLMSALNLPDCEVPTVIFLDLNMPLKNGFECLDEIKQNIRLNSLSVIIFSTSFDLTVVRQLYEKGASYYLRKPSSFADLKLFIHKTLDLLLDIEDQTRNEQNFIIHPKVS